MAITVYPTPSAATTPVGASSLIFSGYMNTGNYTYGSSLAAGTYIVTYYGTASGAKYAFTGPASNKSTVVLNGDTGTITTTTNETSFNISQNLNGNWTPLQSFGTTNMQQVAYGNNKFVAIGAAYAASTSNGTSWAVVSHGVASSNAVGYGNNLWLIGGGNSTGNLSTSTDLITWTARTSNTTSGIIALNYGNGLYLYGTPNGGIGTSTDGITWTSRTSNSAGGDVLSIGYYNNQYIATGYDYIGTSPTGATWTARTRPFSARQIWGVAYGNSVYVTVANSGGIATSTDAVTWTVRTSGTTADLFGVVFGNGIFTAAGSGSLALTSTDGITWNGAAPSIAGTQSIKGIAYGNNLWVVVGGQGWSSVTPASAGYVTVYSASGSTLN